MFLLALYVPCYHPHVADVPVVIIGADGQISTEGGSPSALRTGRWAVLSSSGGVIVMARQTVGGKAGGAPNADAITLWGDIANMGGLTDVIGFIQQNQWSGSLRTFDGPVHRTIWFKAGDVRTAGSNVPDDRIGEILYRFGRITRADLDRALVLAEQRGQRIGQTLVELGIVSSHDVFSYLRKQVEEVFYAAVLLRQGAFYFERSSSLEDLPDLAVSTQALLFDGIRRMDEMKYFRARIPSSATVVAHRPGAPGKRPDGEHPRALLALLDSGPLDVETLARESKLGEFETTRELFQLLQAGFVQIQKDWEVIHSGLHHPVNKEGSGLIRLVDVCNELLAKIHATLAASNKAERFRADLGAFFRGATGFRELFEGISAQPDGRLPVDGLMGNLGRCAVPRPAEYLHQALNELLFFLVFTVGELVGRHEEQELGRRLNEILKEIQASDRERLSASGSMQVEFD